MRGHSEALREGRTRRSWSFASSSHRLASLMVSAAGLLLASGCSERMGHNVEDLTYVSNGPLAGHIVSLDGYDVYSAVVDGRKVRPRKVFNLQGTSISGGPRGIAYIPQQRAFVYTNPRKPDYLLRSDLHGNEIEPIRLSYPDGFVHYHSEGLAFIPPDAPRFAGKLLMVAVQVEPEFRARIFVVDLSGAVVDELILEGDLHQGWISTISYDNRGGVVVTQGDNKVHRFDLQGKKTGEPVVVEGAKSLEGIAVTAEGSFFVGDLYEGHLRALDKNLAPEPKRDRSYKVGKGVTFPMGLVWRPDLQRLVVEHLSPDGFRFVEMTMGLKQVKPQFSLEYDATFESSLGWIAEEGVYSVLRASSGEVWMIRPDGTKTGTLDLSDHMPILSLDYVPSRQQFVLLTGKKDGEAQEIHLVNRDGTAAGEMDLAELSGLENAVSMTAYIGHKGLSFLVAQTPEFGSKMVSFDLDGTRLWELDYRSELGLVYPANLSALGGAASLGFAASDPGSSRITVFSEDGMK